MCVHVPCKYGTCEDLIENSGTVELSNIFSLQRLWELFVTMATRVLNQTSLNSNAGNPTP